MIDKSNQKFKEQVQGKIKHGLKELPSKVQAGIWRKFAETLETFQRHFKETITESSENA